MTELIFNQLAVTLPIHFFAYAPFLDHLRWGRKKTFALVAAMEIVYILLFVLFLREGVSVSLIQLISAPLFGVLFFLSVNMEFGKVMFLYIFSVAYLMALRGAGSFLALALFGSSEQIFYSWASSIFTLLLFLLSMPFMLWYFRKTAQIVFEFEAPQIWKHAFLLPLFTTLLVILFTYSPQSASHINGSFLLARILLILCMFIIYYLLLGSIARLKQQIATEEHANYLEQLTDIQAAQYALLKSRIEETRKARHDLRAVHGYIQDGNLPALASYLKAYEENIPNESFHIYCQNSAVNSVLGFYAEKAAKADIQMEVSLCPIRETIIPEPEFCVLLGNLLENALDACFSLSAAGSSSAPSITVRAQKTGTHMFFLTVDNTSPEPPNARNGRFLSSKHSGFGRGTESIKSIAEKYQGDVRFEWKDGMFFASVMLNP